MSSLIQTPPICSDDFWDIALIRQYDLTGPRYTSYPTVLKFDEGYSQGNWVEATQARKVEPTPIALYLHIPFCDTICYYCACNKIVTANRDHAEKYLNYLKKEITLKAQHINQHKSADVNVVHFGGGTPTYFNNTQLEELMQHLRAEFHLLSKDKLECAIEIRPQGFAKERLIALKNMGFNRISLGVQDFDHQVQKAVNRFNTKEEVHALIQTLRQLDFQSCSIDLIYGLPLQRPESFSSTLNDVMTLSPDRISLFNYAHMPHLFKTQKKIDATQLPEPQEKLQILHDSIATLQQHGYRYIGMDHFAKESDELCLAQQRGQLHRNFQGYTDHNNDVLHAFGVSAISNIHHHYAQNVKTLNNYYAALDDDRLPIEKGYELHDDDLLRRHIINTLLCQFELYFDDINQDFSIVFTDYFMDELKVLKTMEIDGLVKLGNNRLQINERGRLLARSVCQVFDRYIDTTPNNQPRYSRII